jgi:uncharacterized protein YegP (UPF0339 family)
MSMCAEVWEGKRGFYWHFKGHNGKVTADSEAFPTKGNALRAAKSVVRGVVNLWPGKPVYFTVTPSRDGKKTVLRWS